MSKIGRPDSAAWAAVFQILPMTVKELKHLRTTADRLRALGPDLAWAESLENDVVKAEMLDAFVARFGRLQDTLGDKLLPALLRAGQERTGPQLDNLLLAEKLGWLDSAERWIELRALRNRLVHEYVSSAADLLQATLLALDGVTTLAETSATPPRPNRTNTCPAAISPIRPPAALRDDPPDAVLILPWNLAEEVRGQLGDLAEQGVRFVTAVPRLDSWQPHGHPTGVR